MHESNLNNPNSSVEDKSECKASLVKKRGTLKAKITSFSNYLKRLKTDDISGSIRYEIIERLNRAEGAFNDFDEIQSKIEYNEEDPTEQFNEREQFEISYYETVAKAKCLLKDPSADSSRDQMLDPIDDVNDARSQSHSGSYGSASQILAPVSQIKSVKLPDIKLPTFSGDYNAWLEFRDTFTSLIHCRKDMDDIQKFHYLRASLDGTASQVIKSIELSSKNYNMAFDILCRRYNNKNILIHNHLDSLFSIEKISKSSSSRLRALSDDISKHLRALTVLEQNVASWDIIIIHLITKCLDSSTLTKWEEFKANKDGLTLENMYEFLEDRADLLERLEGNRNISKPEFVKDKKCSGKYVETKSRGLLAASNSEETKMKLNECSFCTCNHDNHSCDKFLKLPIAERIEQARNKRLCLNCLRPGHFTRKCHFRGSCKKCCGRHNTLLHLGNKENSTGSEEVTLASCEYATHTLLSTAVVNIRDKHNVMHSVRALLDSGSMSCFITESLSRRLNLDMEEINYAVSGINDNVCKVKYKSILDVHSRNANFNMKISCLVLPKITNNLPAVKLDITKLKFPRNMKLADPTFYKPGPIDLLIGADHFYQILCAGYMRLGVGKPIVQKTKLGWVVSGKLEGSFKKNIQVCCATQKVDDTNEMMKQALKFFELEEVSFKSPWSHEEKECEAHFNRTTKRLESGKFEVSIPLKESLNALGDSLEQAKNRFFGLERKFSRNLSLKQRYSDFLREYENLGHMTKIADDMSNQSVDVSYYLPHHGVLREQSSTTKLRVVFDASARTTSGFSFNDIQMVGPTIQSDLFSILLRFRQNVYVFSADIEKMYRQVSVSPDQRHLQKIIWRENPEDDLSIYQLNTVTYGMAASPYLAIRCLHQLGLECDDKTIAEIIKEDFYVDDILSGCSNFEEAQRVCGKLSSVLNAGSFSLRKWRSNEPRILEACQFEDSKPSNHDLDFEKTDSVKTLGLMWSSVNDRLLYNINVPNEMNHVTKRLMLSNISKIFDPLGLLSPCVILVKIMLQQLWLEKLTWDEVVPSQIHYPWAKFVKKLTSLNDLKIQRNVVCQDSKRIELHLFSDASEGAYGGCAYIRSIDYDDRVHCHLLCARARVAPIKPTTIPRLELCAAFLVAKLSVKITNTSKLRIDRVNFWTDSKIVLGWLNMSANVLKTFVRNRVVEIQERTNVANWFHVPSSENPADLLSRGLMPDMINENDLWWHGPPWLWQGSDSWPKQLTCHFSNSYSNKLPEVQYCTNVLFSTENMLSFPFDRFSTLNKLKRCCAFILRFKRNCLVSKENRELGQLTMSEIKNAFLKLIRIAQRESFPQDFDNLYSNEQLHKKSKILSLTPFLDSDNIIRVGGRLSNTHYNFDKKHPILLSPNHCLTKLLLENEHRVLLHAGSQQILSSLKEKFWPICGRNLAKAVVHRCLRCHRFRAKAIQPMMGNLPKTRFLSGFPFQATGIDYGGPIFMRDRKGRGAKIIKCYISLFVCFSTKCVHLELVSDLSTDTFLLALKRFIARRGKPLHLYSDNGKSFVKGNKELLEFEQFLHKNQETLSEFTTNQGIEWHFIPSYAPNFGGLWEAGIKCTKHHLKRVMGNAHLTFEELTTLLTQIEAVLNSRPLSPLSTDPNDPYPLTPAHFLIGRSLTSIMEPQYTDIPESRLSQYQRLEQLRQHFWARWYKEYIAELQQRIKWKTSSSSLKIGELVLVKDNNLPPLDWQLGRVIDIFPGKDGISRVASIKTIKGVIKRACSKLCPLPLNNELE